MLLSSVTGGTLLALLVPCEISIRMRSRKDFVAILAHDDYLRRLMRARMMRKLECPFARGV